MDLSAYPNLKAVVDSMGKVRSGGLHKKKYENAESTWQSLNQEELEYLERMVPNMRTFSKNSYKTHYTPRFILARDGMSTVVIRVTDLIWMYPSLFTQSAYFIPVSRQHSLIVRTRQNQAYVLYLKQSGPFKKDLADNAMKEILEVVGPQRKGLIIGHNDEIEKAVREDFQGVVNIVDNNSAI